MVGTSVCTVLHSVVEVRGGGSIGSWGDFVKHWTLAIDARWAELLQVKMRTVSTVSGSWVSKGMPVARPSNIV